MVETGSASCGVKNTASVGLEDHLVGLNGDGKGLSGESALHLGDAVGGDETVRADVNRGGGGPVVFAGGDLTTAGGVGVDGLELGHGGLVVLESLVLPATIASVVLGGAGDELLLREG